MNKKLLIAGIAVLVSTSTMAQSAFQGFYGQIATGYESNSIGSGNGSVITLDGSESYPTSSSSQQFGGAPLVLGIGYNFSVAPKWLIGIGADYSAISQTSSAFTTGFSASVYDLSGTGTFSGNSIQLSNRFNIFIAPGYEIDSDKLIYLKAGYSSISAKLNGPSSYTASVIGLPQQQASVGMSSSTSTVGGYIVGIGYKQIITGGIYGFAEANYMSYSKPSFTTTGNINWDYGSYPITSKLSANLNSYQALVGIGYRF
jgi:hypothetical protein